MSEILLTQDLSYQYEGQNSLVFPDISLLSGEALLVTGNSGTGKTTLLHLLGGLLRARSGKLLVNGANLGQMSSRELDAFRGKNIGLVLQQSYFVDSISVLENICLASWLATGQRNVRQAREILGLLGLESQEHKLPSRLSIGQQQRVSIARALVNRPAILLADEPTSSLDDSNALKVANLLQDASAQTGASLVLVTHDQRLKQRFQNQVAL